MDTKRALSSDNVMTEQEVNKVIKLEGRDIPKEYKDKTTEECHEIYQKFAKEEKVALLNMQFAPNLGTVVRTACLWALGEVLTFGKNYRKI